MREGDQPYRKASPSQNDVLCKEKPCSCTGKAVSQLEAPFLVPTEQPFEN